MDLKVLAFAVLIPLCVGVVLLMVRLEKRTTGGQDEENVVFAKEPLTLGGALDWVKFTFSMVLLSLLTAIAMIFFPEFLDNSYKGDRGVPRMNWVKRILRNIRELLSGISHMMRRRPASPYPDETSFMK